MHFVFAKNKKAALPSVAILLVTIFHVAMHTNALLFLVTTSRYSVAFPPLWGSEINHFLAAVLGLEAWERCYTWLSTLLLRFLRCYNKGSCFLRLLLTLYPIHFNVNEY